MGLFDSIKKKNKAKQLSLSIEQYDEYIDAAKQGVTLEQYKRYLSSLSERINLSQFIDYLRLEKDGLSDKQIMRYLTELSPKIKIEDYPDFLEAEKNGLSQSEYIVYSNTLKSKMTSAEYIDFLKAQKIGLTLGKYLQYLKSFKEKMTLEEYGIYLQAESNGMNQEQYAEYLKEYKDRFSVERYLEFDKARSLGITLEEYDLRAEASKAGVSVEQFKAHKEAEKLGMSDEEYAIYLGLLKDNLTSADTITIPESLTELPKNVFKQFSFRKIIFNSALTEISDEAFDGCEHLAELTIPENIKQIGYGAFRGCRSLQKVTFNTGLEKIGDNAFEDCTSLREVYIPGTVEDFGHHVFMGCNALKSIEFEYGVYSIDISDWTDLPKLHKVISPATISIYQVSPFRKGDPKYGIINPDYSFHKISETEIPDYIVPGNYAEYGIEEHREEIEYLEVRGGYVFIDLAGFKNLKAVKFSAMGSVRSVRDCPSLQMIHYNYYVAGIPDGTAVTQRQREKEIIDSKTLTMSGFDAPSLRFVSVDDGPIAIDLDNAAGFKLAWLHIPYSCLKIGINTPVISAVSIHGNCKVSNHCLNNTNNLSVIRFDKDIQGNGIYSNSKAEKILPAEFSHCDLIDLQYDTDTITSEQFGIQSAVKAIRLPAGVKSIKDNAFKGWGIEEMTIPASVEEIGNNVFTDCRNLKHVVFEGRPHKFGCDLFSGCDLLKQIEINEEKLSISEFSHRFEKKIPVSKPSFSVSEENHMKKSNINGKPDKSEIVKAKPAVLSSAPSASKTPVHPAGNSNIPDGVLYRPGKEPAPIRRKIERLFERLNEVYPDRVIVGLHNKYKKLGEKVTELYRQLGYPDGNSFLNAYGYTTVRKKANIPLIDPAKIVNELKRRYAGGNVCTTMTDLAAENPDLAPKFKTLSNRSAEFFGMSLKKYFIQEGILAGKAAVQYAGGFEILKSRYADKPFAGTLNELKSANNDIDWDAVNKYYLHSGSKDTFKVFLINQGILLNQEMYVRAKLAEITEELKKRYPEENKFSGTFAKLKSDNTDLPVGSLNSWTMHVHNETAKDYLIRTGIMKSPELVIEDKLAAVTETLKEKYVYGEQEAYTLLDLQKENPDLPINSINLWANEVCNQSAAEYLKEQGILTEDPRIAEMRLQYERMEAERKAAEARIKAREERLEAEMKAPVETIYYEPSVFMVDEIDISGDAVSGWEFKDNNVSCDDGIVLCDYHGPKKHIILPASINGKKVCQIDTFAFQECAAETIEIPGSYARVPEHMCFDNRHLKTLIIGEGIKEIGEDAFYNVPNLENVYVSQSVEMVYGTSAFQQTKWYDNVKDYAVIGKVLIKYKGNGAVLNVPHGVKTVGAWVDGGFFEDVSNLRKVILPSTVTTLCDDAFGLRKNCDIREFIYTDSLTYIGFNAFGNNRWTESFGDKPIIINGQLYQLNVSGTHAVIPDSVTKVCAGVFIGNENLQYVTFPSTLKSIGKHAFAKCQKLTSVTLPEGMERLEENCFCGCSNLSSVSIPDSLTFIGKSAFDGCTGLKEIKLGKSVEIIDEKAFNDCSILRNFTMNDMLRTIGNEAFSGCTALQKISLPESLIEIGSAAFRECKSLNSIIIPDGINEIKFSTFDSCKALETVSFGKSIKSIGDTAFFSCTSLKEIQLPKIVGTMAFCGCSRLKKAVFHPEMSIIEMSTFSGCTSLTEIVIPDSVAKIEMSAFERCSNLTEIIIPDSVTQIESYTFKGCSNLKKIILPSELVMIKESAFEGCTVLQSITIPDTVKTIESNAFKDCRSLSEVTMPDAYDNFGVDVFTHSPYMKNWGDFVIRDGILVKYNGTEKEIIIPEDVNIIGENAFSEAYQVETIAIPDTVRRIAGRLFGTDYTSQNNNHKPQLRKVIAGNGVTSIGDEAFIKCEKLTEVNFGTKLSSIGQKAFAGCCKLKCIDLGRTAIKVIPQETFRDCCNVNKVILPNGIEMIGRRAFSGIKLRVLQLPRTVKEVEQSAFNGTSELIVYDTISPDAVDAKDWEYDLYNGSVNSPLACAMLDLPDDYLECQGNTIWNDYHITVLSAENGDIRYRIFCDSKEREDYRIMMFSAWGRNASFKFDAYDDYFTKIINMSGRTDMAFCRIQYPEGLSAEHRANYEIFLERCMYIERSAKRTAEMIADDDAVERLMILDKYHAIHKHNIDWIRNIMNNKKAKKCQFYLDKHYYEQ